MIQVKFQSSGAATFLTFARDMRNAITEGIEEALEHEANEWRKLVISSTWFSPRPSPTSMIIGRYRKDSAGQWSLEYGWLHYKGDPARAEWRAMLRKDIYDRELGARVAARVAASVARAAGAGGE